MRTILMTIVLLAGCQPQPVVTSTPVTATANDAAEEASVDELPLAVDSLRKLAEGASPESMMRDVSKPMEQFGSAPALGLSRSHRSSTISHRILVTLYP